MRCDRMETMSQLKEKLFSNGHFLNKLIENYYYLSNSFQHYDNLTFTYPHPSFQAKTGKNFESLFLSVLSEEVHKRLPELRILLSIDMIFKEQGKGKMLHLSDPWVDEVRGTVCNPAWFESCGREIKEDQKIPSFHSTKCFGGREWHTEIDAVISKDSVDLCFVEYEEKISALCNNFMKMHRLKRTTPDRPFSSLFVTRVSNEKEDSTLDQLNDYMAKVGPSLDRLLKEWRVLAIVDLFRRKPRLRWYPS